MPDQESPATTELLVAIIALLIPLLIWAFGELERQKCDRLDRYLSRRKTP
jgi:hypothetical protein